MLKKIFLDSSCLIAAFHAQHLHHKACLGLVQSAHDKTCRAAISCHSIAEVYSVLTRLPGANRVLPEQAWELIHQNIDGKLDCVELSGEEYVSLTRELSMSGHAGGLVYDGIIWATALKWKPAVFYTLNTKHFRLFNRQSSIEIVEPEGR